MKVTTESLVAAVKKYAPFVVVAIFGALLYGGVQQVRQFYVDYQDFKLIRQWAGPQVNRWLEQQRRGQKPMPSPPTQPSQTPELQPSSPPAATGK